MKPMVEIELDTDNYTILVINDVMRMLIIQVVVQVLFAMKNSSIECFSQVFIENTLFIILGVMVYWLVFKSIVDFKSTKPDDTSVHYQSVY